METLNTGIVKVGIVTILIKDGAMLLGKRKNIFGDGTWGLPGGHLEFGESLTEAAVRELKEETGIISKKISFSHVVNDPRLAENKHYIHFAFHVTEYEREATLVEPDKCYEWRWFPLDALPQGEEIFIGHRKVIPAFSKGTPLVDL